MSPAAGSDGGPVASPLGDLVTAAAARLHDAHQAREAALPACRRVIRLSSSAIRAVHRLQLERAADLRDEAATALAEARAALDPFPAVEHGGFFHDAAKEYAEACLTAALVDGDRLPDAEALGVPGPAWLNGLAEAASELRRHALDRLRAGQTDEAERLLEAMDDVYDALVGVDLPDALTGGLRRSVDALRAVVERTRGDVTTTVLQARLQAAIEGRSTAHGAG